MSIYLKRTETVTTLVPQGDGTYVYTNENGDQVTFCAPADFLPDVSSCVSCDAGVLNLLDSSSAVTSGMTFAAGAVSIEVSDGTTTAPAVTGDVQTAFVLDVTGLDAAAATWTISQTVTATVCGQQVSKTCTLDIEPCV